ncbi:membrane protein [Rhodopirellula maiorica SM1]|uniref:Membrane protein n=1 Tax=Rhodopirellula maiorica SM1 TaxID=1265738 RepID=M5RQF2_9BACT|nr:hypothetical protein [Rhodopirellula maiorica]EMI16184.1 membrane protein [Rhodopirellula maiorica SM1]
MSPEPQSDREKPSLKSACVSPSAISNLVTALALLACVLLPHSIGCDDKVVRPIDVIGAELNEGPPLVTLTFFWPYVFGLCTFLFFIALVIIRPQRIERVLLSLPVCLLLYLTAIWCLLLFSSSAESRVAMVIATFVVPSATLVAIRVTWLWIDGRKLAAATWAQSYLCVLAIFSLRWFWILPIKQMLYGGVLSMIAAAAVMIASWTWPCWIEHDLSDRNHPAERFQLSLKQIVLGMLVIAIAMTYWQFMARQ